MCKLPSVFAIVMLAVFATMMVQGQTPTAGEQYLLSAINQERATNHLAPVRLDALLMRAAATHAELMAGHRGISHQFRGEADLLTRGSHAGARFDRITENVAEGPTVVVLHDAWMHSAGHRANILDAGVDAVGIAVVASGRQLYAVEDFESTVRSLTLEAQEGAVAMLLDRAGLELVPDTRTRQTCAMLSGYAGDQQPAFVVRYTTGDLWNLPSQLKQRLALGQDHQASVGACTVRGGRGAFSMYSIAVVLYP